MAILGHVPASDPISSHSLLKDSIVISLSEHGSQRVDAPKSIGIQETSGLTWEESGLFMLASGG